MQATNEAGDERGVKINQQERLCLATLVLAGFTHSHDIMTGSELCNEHVHNGQQVGIWGCE